MKETVSSEMACRLILMINCPTEYITQLWFTKTFNGSKQLIETIYGLILMVTVLSPIVFTWPKLYLFYSMHLFKDIIIYLQYREVKQFTNLWLFCLSIIRP